jgi:hypothetical protein
MAALLARDRAKLELRAAMVRRPAWPRGVETISRKRGVAIAANAIVSSLRAAARLNHFERFVRRDGGWSAQSSSLWTSSRANFLIQGRASRSRGLPAVPAIESPRFAEIVSRATIRVSSYFVITPLRSPYEVGLPP